MVSPNEALPERNTVVILERIEEHLAVLRERSLNISRNWLTVQEAADQLQVSRDTIERLISSGKLKAAAITTSTGNGQRKMYRLKVEWLEEFLTSSLMISKPQAARRKRRRSRRQDKGVDFLK